MKIGSVRHAWPEPAGFHIWRPKGHPGYTFLHFFNPVQLTVKGETVITQPHACIFYSSGEPQEFVSEAPLTHDWIHFRSDTPVSPSAYNIEDDRIYYPANPEYITALFRELENEFFAAREFRGELLENIMQRFFIFFARAVSSAPTVSVSDESTQLLSRVRREVLLHPERPWRVEDMAALTRMSISHFYASYRNTFGNSPTADLIEARIRTAKSLLLTESMPIASLAERLGYNSPYHFIRQFREHTGQTPAAYRKRPVELGFSEKKMKKIEKPLDSKKEE